MSATTKFPDILGTDWNCIAEPPLPKKDCPNYDYPGPELDNTTGEWLCRKCFRVLGNQNSTDDEIHDDDMIDDENAEEVEIAYVAEGEKNTDFTPEQSKRVNINRELQKIIAIINNTNQEFAMSLSNNQYHIADIIIRLMDKNVEGFQIGGRYRPRIIAVNSHLLKRLPYTAAMKVLKITNKTVNPKKVLLDNLYRTDIDNPMDRAISDIGKQLGVNDKIISLAIEEYGKRPRTNKEPKILAQAGAWLYLYAKKSNFKLTKKDFSKIPNLSRDALNRAIASYKDLPQS